MGNNDILIIGGLALAGLFLLSKTANASSQMGGAAVAATTPAASTPAVDTTLHETVKFAPAAVSVSGFAGLSPEMQAKEVAAVNNFPEIYAQAAAVTAAGGQGGELLSHNVPGYLISGYVPASLNPNMFKR